MEYIFYSHYLLLLLKGKYKTVRVSLTVLLFIVAAIFGFSGILNFLTGKPISLQDVLLMIVFILCMMNIGHAVFYDYTPDTAKEKVKVENKLAESKNEIKTENRKETRNTILPNKNYGSGIKSSPKTEETKKIEAKKEEAAKVKPAQALSRKETNEKTVAPPLEINVASTEEFQGKKEETEKDKEELSRDYTGEIHQEYMADSTEDSTEIPAGREGNVQESALPDSRNVFYDEEQLFKARFKT